MIGWRKHSTITLEALEAPYATTHTTQLNISTIHTVDQFLVALPSVCEQNQLQELKALFSHAQNHFANDHMPSAMFYRDQFGHTPIHLMALFCPLPSIKALFQWMQDAAPAIIFNAHIENCYGLTAYDIANQRFNPTSDMAQRHALLGIIDATIGRATTGTASKTQLPKDIIHCTAASKMRYTNEAQFLPATG